MKNKFKISLLQISIFVFMFIFFTRISPLVPFDADDWLFNGTMRAPYPLWGAFNPTRILPEILDPFGGSIAAFCVYPFTKDYVGSITLVQAVIISIFIVIMFSVFFYLLVKKFSYSINTALIAELMFFLSFFLIFKHINAPSYTGFWTVDLTCVFFYLIPGLLNGTSVFLMIKESNFGENFNKFNNRKKGLFLLIFYFALFSNSQFNIIIATCTFCLLIESSYKNTWKIFNFSFFKRTWIYLLILFTWLITVFFDLHGGRAKNLSISNRGTLHQKLVIVVGQFHNLLSTLNTSFIFFMVIVIALAIFSAIYLKKDNSFLKLMVINIISLILSLLYLFLAYAKAIPRYASRVDAMWPVLFYFLFIFGLSLAFIVAKFNIVKNISPLIIILSCFIAFNFSCPPIPSLSGIDPSMNTRIAKKIDYYIIGQVIDADQNGKSKVIVKVPQGSLTDNNWPQSYYMAPSISQSLYSAHIINHRINVEFKPSLKVNNHFRLAVKSQPFNPLER